MADVVEDLTKSRATTWSPSAARPRGDSPVKFIVLAMLALAAVAGGWTWLHFRNRVSSDDAQVDAHRRHRPQDLGHVIAVLVNDNQAVKAGDVLVRIDPRDYQARSIWRAPLSSGRKPGDLAHHGPHDQRITAIRRLRAPPPNYRMPGRVDRAQLSYEMAASSDIAVSEAKVRSKQASNERAQADLARMKPLLDKEEISRLQYDSYQAQARVAESELRAAQEELSSVQKNANIRKSAVDAAQSKVNLAQSQVAGSLANRKQVDVRRAETGTAAAGVEAARAALGAAELMLSYTTITAPSDGVVTRKSVEPGQIVQPGQSLMMSSSAGRVGYG